MAQPPIQDFVNSVDFTGSPTLSGSLLNQALNTLKPSDGSTNTNEGIGLAMLTYDTDIGVPNVPNPANPGNNKQTRYIWIRVPFLSDPSTTRATLYTWNANPNTVRDPVFLNWLPAAADLTSINTQLSTLQVDTQAALDAANTANSNATNALLQSVAANTTAVNANSAATTAQNQAVSANTAATAANNAAQTATTVSQSASANASTALTAATNAKFVSNLTAGTAGQRLRSNYGATPIVEWFSPLNTLIQLTDGSTVTDTGANVISFAANVFQFAQGVYKYTATGNNLAYSIGTCQIRLYDILGASVINTGYEGRYSSGTIVSPVNVYLPIDGIFTTDGTRQYRFEATHGIGGTGFTTLPLFNAIFERIG